MADEKISLHVDTDWKKQAQEEKRRLADQAAAAKSKEPIQSSTGAADGSEAAPAAESRPGGRQRGRGMPVPSFAMLVQSMLIQALYYLGDTSARGGEPVIDLDMAKYQIDMLGVLEEKSRNNLGSDEQRLLDTALYEARMRYVSVASQYT